MYKTGLYSKRPENTGLPERFQKCKGINIWIEGKKYKDFSTMGIGCNLLGYNNKKVNKQVKKIIDKGNFSSISHEIEFQLSSILKAVFKYQGIKLFKTGGEACLNAVKLAQCYTKTIDVLQCGYSGHHIEHLNLKKFDYNNTEQLKSIYNNEKIIILEACRNQKPDIKFFAYINYLQKQGVIIILDEITSGFRFKWGESIKHYLTPDIIIFGKAIANGYPLSLIMYNEKIESIENDIFISSTMFTDSIGVAACLETLKQLAKKKYYHINVIGQGFKSLLENIAKRNNIKIKFNDIPELLHYEFIDDSDNLMLTYFIQEMRKESYIITNSFYPSFKHKNYHFIRLSFALEKVLRKLSFLSYNQIESLLEIPLIKTIEFKKRLN